MANSRYDTHTSKSGNVTLEPHQIASRKAPKGFKEPAIRSRFDTHGPDPQSPQTKRFQSVSPTDIRMQVQDPSRIPQPATKPKTPSRAQNTIEWGRATQTEEAVYNGSLKERTSTLKSLAMAVTPTQTPAQTPAQAQAQAPAPAQAQAPAQAPAQLLAQRRAPRKQKAS